MKRNRKDLPVMDICLVIVGLIAVIFTTVMTVIFCRYGATPDTLIIGVFGLLGGECGFLAIIKSTKEKNRTRREELEDRQYMEEREKEMRREADWYGGDPQ